MRKMTVEVWKAKDKEGKEQDETILEVLSTVLSVSDPQKMPRGFDAFRSYSKISKAFEKATETNELVLEESDYDFLKNSIVRDVPSVWAMNHKLREAIENFMAAEEISG